MKIIKSNDAFEYWLNYHDYKLTEMEGYVRYLQNPSSKNKEAWDNARKTLYDFMDRMVDDLRS